MWSDARAAYIDLLCRRIPKRAAQGDAFHFHAPFLWDVVHHYLRKSTKNCMQARRRAGDWDVWLMAPRVGTKLLLRILSLDTLPSVQLGASKISLNDVTQIAFNRRIRHLRFHTTIVIKNEGSQE